MVAPSREAPGTGRLRPLNMPRPLAVRASQDGTPAAVRVGGGWQEVQEVQDRWRVDDEWWREQPVSRLYYRVLLEDGRCLTLFHDLATGRWHEQRYG